MSSSSVPSALKIASPLTRGMEIPKRENLRGDYAIAAGCVAIQTLGFIGWSDSILRWFVLPVMACGVLSAVDIVRWLRGRLDLFDPRTIIGCLAFYGLFVAPLLNVCWDTFGVGDLVFWGD